MKKYFRREFYTNYEQVLVFPEFPRKIRSVTSSRAGLFKIDIILISKRHFIVLIRCLLRNIFGCLLKIHRGP